MRPWQLREQRSCRDGEETVQREAVDGFVWHPGLRISHEFRDPLRRLPRLALICVAGAGNHDDAVAGGVREMLGKIAQERDWLAAGEDVERADEKAREDFAKKAGSAGGRAAPAIRTVTSIFPSTTSAPGSRIVSTALLQQQES